jgi:hypothetical protein
MNAQQIAGSPTPTSPPHVSSMDVQQSTAVVPTNETQSWQPRANLPLLRELCDKIYGYLLEGKHIRVNRLLMYSL